MMLQLHIALLAACPLIACLAVLFAPTKPIRSRRILAAAIFPYLLFGIGSMLLLSAAGVPTTEWIIPALCSSAVILFCRSTRMTIGSYVAFLGITIGLIANFFEIVRNEYTANPAMTAKFGESQQQHLINQGLNELELARPEGGTSESGPLSKNQQKDPKDRMAKVHVENEWHTIFTRLFRVVSTPRVPDTESVPPKQAIPILNVKTDTAE